MKTTKTLTCEEYWLRALDGDAAPSADPELLAHLQSCEECLAEQRVMDALMETSVEPNPFHLKALARRVEARRMDRRPRGTRFGVACACATALALSAIVWFVGVFPTDQRPERPEAPSAIARHGAIAGQPSAAPRVDSTTRSSMPAPATTLQPIQRPSSLGHTAQFFALDEGLAVANGSLARSLAQFEGFFDLGG